MNTNFENMSLDELLDVLESEEYGSLSKMLARQFIQKHFEAAQQKMHLTALRRVLWVSFFVHIVSGLVLLYSVFGGR